jgi:hypothetical protein
MRNLPGTKKASSLPKTQDTVPRIWYGTVPKRVIHKPDLGKIGLDWNPVNWVQQGKIRG